MGWARARDYEQHEIAENSEDEKKTRQAENRAIKSLIREKHNHPKFYARAPTNAKSESALNQNST